MKKYKLLAGAAAFALAAGLFIAYPKATSAATIPSGITAGGVDLSGLSKEDAHKKVTEQVASMAERQITLNVDGNAIQTTASELGFYWANEKEVEAAIEKYSGGNLLERYLDMKELQKAPVALDIETEVDEQKISDFVTEKGASFIRGPQDAQITKEGEQFIVTDSVEGLVIDVQATKTALDEVLKSEQTEATTVEAVITTSQPARSKEALSTISDVLGTFSTGFNTGSVSRSTNLRNGAAKINGTVLMPGEEFSAYTWLTPFTESNGYASAASYENGKVVDSVGGGACQICTTLYNTALRAEVEITQRQNHSMIVTYVKPSEDAAIAGTMKDLKFKNNYETPIYIEGVVSGGTIAFTIYGKETRPANRTVKFVSETLGTTDPGAPTMKTDNSLSPGAKVREQSAHVGKTSRLWKYVYVDGVETEKEILHTDSYMASKAVYRVGPAVSAPAVSTPAPPEAPPVEVQPTPPPTEAPAGPASDPGLGNGPAGPAGPAAEGPGAE